MRVDGIVRRLDIIAALVGGLIGALIFSLFPSQRPVAVAVILGCAAYLVFRNKIRVPGAVSPKLSSRQRQLLNTAFWCLFIASCWLWQTQSLYHRPLAYFIVTSLLAGIIAVEILCFSEKSRAWTIILKILLLSASIRMGMFYEFPSLSGADAYFHARAAQYIANTGSVPPFEVAQTYSDYPIFHLAVAMTQVLTSLSLKNAIFVSIGLNAIISTAFIYLVGKKLVGPKAGLLAVLLANVGTFLITEGALNIIPASLVTCFFLLMLYLLHNRQTESRSKAILIGLTCLIVITHQLSVFVVLVSLAALFLVSRAGRAVYSYSHRVGISAAHLSLFAAMLLLYWQNTYFEKGRTFFATMVSSLESIFLEAEFGEVSEVTRGIHYGTVTNTLFDLGYLILLPFAIGGVLWWFSKRDDWKFSIAGMVIVLYVFVYGIPAFGTRAMLTGRWFPILIVFLAITGAVYFIELIRLIKPHTIKITTGFILVSLLTFFMIATPNVNKDNPFYAMDRAGRTQFKASEVSGISTLNEVYAGTIRTDSLYSSGVMRQLDLKSRSEGFSEEYINGGPEESSGALAIVRQAIFQEPTTIEDIPKPLVIDGGFLERFATPDYSLVYNNGEVAGYLAR